MFLKVFTPTLLADGADGYRLSFVTDPTGRTNVCHSTITLRAPDGNPIW